MDSELTAIASVKALNQGVATGDSPTFVAVTGTLATAAQTNITSVGTLSALTVTGEITANGGIALSDNDKATFGASDDLQIYHDGANSYINDTSGTGNLYVASNQLIINNSPNNENMARFAEDGSVTLYHNGLEKLATTATGIDISGTATMDGLTVDGNPIINGTSPQIFLQTGASHTNWQIAAQENVANAFEISSGAADASAPDDTYTKRLVVQNNGDISFYEDTGTTPKFFWDASAESLGIGTSSPDHILCLEDAEPTLRIFDTANTLNQEQTIAFGTEPGDRTHAEIAGINTNTGNAAGALSFKTNAGSSVTERMRIDDSGNLLVSTTSAVVANSASNVGTAIGSGLIESARAGVVAQLNRHSTDGSILDFQKDGTTVGSIGSVSSDIMIGTGDTGLRFVDAVDAIAPCTTAGSQTDAQTDIGRSSFRFKNAYLSGGVYLGGTGAANLLDDYESGTWTPVFADAVTAGNTATMTADGRYTKIGRLITVECRMLDIDTTGMTAGNNIFIRGLPEVVSANSRAIGSVSLDRVNFTNYVVVIGGANTSYALLSDQIDSDQDVVLTVAAITSTGSDITFTLQYTI